MPFIDTEVKDGMLTVQQISEGDRVRLALNGELDLSNVPTVEATLEEAFASDREVVVDLGPLEFIDSTGLAFIVMALRRHDAQRLSFLPCRSAAVRRLLSLTGLDDKIPLSSTGKSAAAIPAA
jgi:anti-sigma B factor antagonist